MPAIEPIENALVREVWSTPRPTDSIQMDNERAQEVYNFLFVSSFIWRFIGVIYTPKECKCANFIDFVTKTLQKIPCYTLNHITIYFYKEYYYLAICIS